MWPIAHVVAGIRTGTLGVNGGIWYAADGPFGGYKQSGIGRDSPARPERAGPVRVEQFVPLLVGHLQDR